MEIFGIGAPEILLILAVALIVFGPDRLPEFAREAGKMVRTFRQLTSEATTEIRSLTTDLNISEDLKKSIEEIKSASSMVTEEVTSLKNEVTGTLTEQYKVTYETVAGTESEPTQGSLSVTTVTSEEETPDPEGVTLTAVPMKSQNLDNLVNNSPATSNPEGDNLYSASYPTHQSASEIAAVSYLNNGEERIIPSEVLRMPPENNGKFEPEIPLARTESYQLAEASSGPGFRPEELNEENPGGKNKPRIAKRSAFGGSRNRNRE